MAKAKRGVLATIDRFLGPKCTLCCTIFSFFGVIVLVVVAGLINKGNSKVQGETVVFPSMRGGIAHATYLASLIYAIFVGVCFARYLWVCRKAPDMEDLDEDDEE